MKIEDAFEVPAFLDMTDFEIIPQKKGKKKTM